MYLVLLLIVKAFSLIRFAYRFDVSLSQLLVKEEP